MERNSNTTVTNEQIEKEYRRERMLDYVRATAVLLCLLLPKAVYHILPTLEWPTWLQMVVLAVSILLFSIAYGIAIRFVLKLFQVGYNRHKMRKEDQENQ